MTKIYAVLFSALPVVAAATSLSEYELPQVVAMAQPEKVIQASAARGLGQTLTQKAIRQRGVSTLSGLLHTLENVVVQSGTGANPSILIRGVPALILLDGQPLSQFSMQNPDLDLIPVADIEQITVSPSSEGVQSGNEAIGGVIDIQTAIPKQTKAAIWMGLGEPWKQQYMAKGETRWHNGMFGRVSTQWMRDEGYRQHSLRSQTNGSVLLGQDYDGGIWSLNWRSVRQDADFPGYLTQSQIGNPTQSVQGQGHFAADVNALQLHWQQQLPHDWLMDTHADYRQQWGVFSYGGSPYQQDYRTLDWHPTLSGSVPVAKQQLHIHVGTQIADEQYTFSDSVIGGHRNQYAGFVQGEMPVMPKWTLSAGDRFIHAVTRAQFVNGGVVQPQSGQTDNVNVYEVGLQYQLAPNWKWYARRDGAYQLPFVDQQASTTGPVSGFGLHPETSISYELGTDWQGRRWQLAAQGYWVQLTNEIMYDPAAGVFGANVNLPPTERIGALAYASYQPWSKLNLHLASTWMHNRFRSGQWSGNAVPGLPNLLVNGYGLYHFTQHWSGLAEVDYFGRSYAVGDNDNIGTRVPGYWLANLGAEYVREHWQISARLNNLTNQRYYSYVSYSNYVAGNLAYYPASGRSFWVTVRYEIS